MVREPLFARFMMFSSPCSSSFAKGRRLFKKIWERGKTCFWWQFHHIDHQDMSILWFFPSFTLSLFMDIASRLTIVLFHRPPTSTQKPGCHPCVLFPWALRRITHERFSPRRRGGGAEDRQSPQKFPLPWWQPWFRLGWRRHTMLKSLSWISRTKWFSTLRRI